MRIFTLIPALLTGSFLAAVAPADLDLPLERIAFGSCSRQFKPQPIWHAIQEQEPDLWIWLGDNIYPDYTPDERMLPRGVTDPDRFAEAYRQQMEHPDYAEAHARIPMIGTWDDHDYGRNNAGMDYALKAQSKEAMLDFLGEPEGTDRRVREGVYGAYCFGPQEKRVKVILLDNRWFAQEQGFDSTLLGEPQWVWLENELECPEAELVILVSGTQIIADQHPYESWARFPQERARLLKLLDKCKAKALVLLSGDRHISELSALRLPESGRMLYDITSSGMTHAWENFHGEENPYRIGEVIARKSFSMLLIEWGETPGVSPRLSYLVIGEAGMVLAAHSLESYSPGE